MEDIDGGLHPEVDGQSLDDDDDESVPEIHSHVAGMLSSQPTNKQFLCLPSYIPGVHHIFGEISANVTVYSSNRRDSLGKASPWTGFVCSLVA